MEEYKMEDIKIKIEIDDSGRKDPTSFLPEEPMTYEVKKKKKKKKKKKELQEDPFKDITIGCQPPVTEICLDPEVNIKVEKIEVELDFNDFTDSTGLMLETVQGEDSQEPAVKIDPKNHEAVILTFESVINENKIKKEKEEPVDTSNDFPPEIPYDREYPTPEFDFDNIEKCQKKVYTCKICRLIFHTKKTLLTHQKRKHKIIKKSFKYRCDYCGTAYDQKNSLVTHIKRKHGPNAEPEDLEDRTCEQCFLVFKGMARLRMHQIRKHGTSDASFQHECSHCGLSYNKYRSLMVHIQRKHSSAPKPIVNRWYSCPFCPKTYFNRETYARHIQRNHKTDENGVLQPKEPNASWVNCTNDEVGEFTCTECPQIFTTVSFLKLHMRRKHNALREDFRLKCKICNLSYEKPESLKRHVRRKHENTTNCTVCNKDFGTREAYMNHSHIREVKECTICGLIFASQGGLVKHLRCLHQVEIPKTVFCNICQEGFYDKRQLKLHFLRVHLNVSFTCKFCKKAFKSKESYRRHVVLKHSVKQQKIDTDQLQKCDKCPETFADEFELCRHINFVHNHDIKPNITDEVEIKKEQDENDLKTFQCTKCPETYNTWDELKLHYGQNHQEVKETQCQICGEFVSKLVLPKHIKEHHTVTVWDCKYCEFKANNKVSLTQHMLRHKNATTLHCDFNGCRYKTFYEDAMEKHKKKHANQGGVKFQCSQCTFQSMNKYILRYHEEAHATGIKRYSCDKCDYKTILPANLVQHKYKHSTEKRFKCEYCPFATKYNTSLRFHVKKKHCDLPTFS